MLIGSHSCVELEAPLPADLSHLGETTKAIVSGDRSAPLIVALGGISGDRFVCGGADGTCGWWPGLVGTGCAIDPARYRVVGVDYAADMTGRTAPTTFEQGRIILAVLDALGAERAEAIVGASYGGMVALAIGESYPSRVNKIVVISAGPNPHPAATAARELQRRVVALGLATGRSSDALAIARGMAMMTYRTAEEFGLRFRGGIETDDPLDPSAPGQYLAARGEAFLSRMSPGRYLSLSASIDRHRVDPSTIAAPTLLIGASSDQLVPPRQMRELAEALPAVAGLHLIDCIYGHDMFLKEAHSVSRLVEPFLGG